MEITERPPTRFDLLGRGEPVYLATQRSALEPWEGEDPPSLAKIWSRKPKFAVTKTGHAPSWPSCITCGPTAGTASG